MEHDAMTWNANMTLRDTACLIERFLEDRPQYAQEWNDFVDTPQRDEKVEVYRRRCYELDPLISQPGKPNPEATAELRSIIAAIKSQ
jgi:hypothetical protein